MSSAVIPIVRVAILADSRLTEIALPVDLPLTLGLEPVGQHLG